MKVRLLIDEAANGARNMAVDEAILLANARSSGSPTLRFYSWQPFCLSLGRLQRTLPELAAHGLENGEWQPGLDIVRRPTGGRAVWHAQEVTYSISAPLEMLPLEFQSVNGAYQWLSQGFLHGLRELGLPVEMAPSGVRSEGANCFSASAGCDFLANGKKLIGAAQCRAEGAFLQHGSILLSLKREEWQERAGGPMEGATSLEELGFSGSRELLLSHLCSGFEKESAASLELGQLSALEENMANELNSKYRSLLWTSNARSGIVS